MKKRTLSRKEKIARNLLLALCFGFVVWASQGGPMPTAELTFRQMERTRFLAQSEIMCTWETPLSVGELGTSSARAVLVGRYTDQIAVGCLFQPNNPFGNRLTLWPREEGITPVPLSALLQGEDGTLFHVLLFLEVPEEAAGAQATITGRIENAKEPVETIQGERWADGVWAFWFPIDSALTTDGDLKYGTKDLEGLPYTLELYRTDGGPLAEQEGTLPENFQSGVIYDPGLYDVLNDILLNQ